MDPLLRFVCVALTSALVFIVLLRVLWATKPVWPFRKLYGRMHTRMLTKQAHQLAKYSAEDRPRVLRIEIALAWLLLPFLLEINAGLAYLVAPARWTPTMHLEAAALLVGMFIAATVNSIRVNRKALRRGSSCLR